MAVNLMAGRDGQNNENNDKKNSNIDLKLDRKNEESGVIKGVEKADSKEVPVSKPVGVPTAKKEPLKIDVKDLDKSAGAAIPDDIGSIEGGGEKKSGNWGSRIVMLIVILLVVGAGVLLYLLNVESQFLRGTVNSIPTSNTNIVDDILSEDFENNADTNIETTEIDPQAQVLSQANEIVNQGGNDADEPEEASTNEIPVVTGNSGTEIPVVQPVPESSSEIVVPESDLPAAPVASSDIRSDEDLITEYNLQSGDNLADNLIAQTTSNNQPTTINQGNDFTPTQSDSDTTVQPNVMESPEISGDTGPGLWLCVMLTALFTYVKYDKKKHV